MHNIMTTDEAVNLLSVSTFCNNYQLVNFLLIVFIGKFVKINCNTDI